MSHPDFLALKGGLCVRGDDSLGCERFSSSVALIADIEEGKS